LDQGHVWQVNLTEAFHKGTLCCALFHTAYNSVGIFYSHLALMTMKRPLELIPPGFDVLSIDNEKE
jgi:hypothetical protein